MENGTHPDGHVLYWQSYPMIRDIVAGNLLLSAAILLCGLTFTGIDNRPVAYKNQRMQLKLNCILHYNWMLWMPVKMY